MALTKELELSLNKLKIKITGIDVSAKGELLIDFGNKEKSVKIGKYTKVERLYFSDRHRLEKQGNDIYRWNGSTFTKLN